MNYSTLNDEMLLLAYRKEKTNTIMNAVLIGVSLGIVIFGAVKNGITFFTLFPLLFVYLLTRSSKNKKLLEAELKARNLSYK